MRFLLKNLSWRKTTHLLPFRTTPGQPPPPEGNFSDTSSETERNFVQPVYHRHTFDDMDSTARARRFVDANDYTIYPNVRRSLSGTPGNGVLGFRGNADGGSELDTELPWKKSRTKP